MRIKIRLKTHKDATYGEMKRHEEQIQLLVKNLKK